MMLMLRSRPSGQAGTNTAERHGEEPTEPQEYPYALSAVSGCPMVVVPAGIDRQGLPFGLQIIGRRWNDERILAIAEVVSELTGGFRQPQATEIEARRQK